MLRRLRWGHMAPPPFEALAHATGLRELNWLVDGEIPDVVFSLTALTCLKIQRTSPIPSSIGQLTGLRELHLGYLNLESLPQSMLELTRLTKIVFSSNDMARMRQVLRECLPRLKSITWVNDLEYID